MQRVTIEKMVFGGYGLARTGSGVLFVENGLLGEILDVVPESSKHDCTVARVEKIIGSSDYRREPPCRHAGVCGGCDWLFIEYEGQLKYKKGIFIDCLKRIGKIDNYPEPEIFGSPESGYRIRAQIKMDEAGNCGFFRKRTNDIVSIGRCPLLCEKINELLIKTDGKTDFFCSGYKPPFSLKVIAGDNGTASDPVIPGITGKTAVIAVGNRVFEVTGGSFFQSNCFLLEKLGTWALPFVGGEYCVDLFGGSGFFSIMLADNFKRGVLIESVMEQVEMARRNYALNGISRFSAVHSTAERIGGAVSEKPDLLVIDPPRPGLTRKAREAVAKTGARSILYISCNPSTQARDIGFFVKHNDYAVRRMALFDLYPNTCHLETAVLLDWKGGGS